MVKVMGKIQKALNKLISRICVCNSASITPTRTRMTEYGDRLCSMYLQILVATKLDKFIQLTFFRERCPLWGNTHLICLSFLSNSVFTRYFVLDSLVLSIPYVRSSLSGRVFSLIDSPLRNSLPPDTRNSSSLPIFRSKLNTPELSTGRNGPASRVGSGHDFAGFWRVG